MWLDWEGIIIKNLADNVFFPLVFFLEGFMSVGVLWMDMSKYFSVLFCSISAVKCNLGCRALNHLGLLLCLCSLYRR